MRLDLSIHTHPLIFKHPSGTSRGVLTQKPSYFIQIWHPDEPERIGIGECSLIPGLSPDERPDVKEKLYAFAHTFATTGTLSEELDDWPAIQFALEMAKKDWESGGTRTLFPSDFTQGDAAIPINGLIWMGDSTFLHHQIREKLAEDYSCIKLKIGALDFKAELDILRTLRAQGGPDLEIRVDANGAFSPHEAQAKLEALAVFNIHSIEQPIRPGQWEEMARLCETTPIPIALDEELIRVTDPDAQRTMMHTIRPQYIILKPSLIGGWAKSEGWIGLAEEVHAGWWATSALESNIGLNAIAQWVFTKKSPLPQGLGTGSLYTNNIPSPLKIKNAALRMDPMQPWQFNWDG